MRLRAEPSVATASPERPYPSLQGSGIWKRKTKSLVDEVDERLADEVATQVVAEEVGHVVDAGGRLAADVRRDDHVRLIPQAAFARQRLGSVTSTRGAAEVARFERGDQVFGDDERPAGDVDRRSRPSAAARVGARRSCCGSRR